MTHIFCNATIGTEGAFIVSEKVVDINERAKQQIVDVRKGQVARKMYAVELLLPSKFLLSHWQRMTTADGVMEFLRIKNIFIPKFTQVLLQMEYDLNKYQPATLELDPTPRVLYRLTNSRINSSVKAVKSTPNVTLKATEMQTEDTLKQQSIAKITDGLYM